MFDFWAFLLQTLTASGVGVLLLIVKALFQDKLPPKWQFAIWGILGISILLPAGLGGRYVLLNWPLVVDYLRGLAGDYGFTRVAFPFPVLTEAPGSFFAWVFAVYTAGVIIFLIRDGIAYLRLRRVIRQGFTGSDETWNRVRTIGIQYGLLCCQTVVVKGLPSAFVFGIFRPVLVLPEENVDDKVIVHELIHLKKRDTIWSIVICLLRALHWCNPFLRYCGRQALNDLETRCDQMVLELLEGEQRRDYGRILLSMANDRYAKTPGATCVNNGGSAISTRIEAIARFKLYPAGMKLVSICSALVLAMPVLVGTQPAGILEYDLDMRFSLASARTTPCTTVAGAFDTYAKAVLDQNGLYRVMCAPESMQEELYQSILDRWEGPIQEYHYWESGLPCWPNSQAGYYIYNLQEVEDGYEGLLVLCLNYPPDGQPEKEGKMYLAVRKLQAEQERGRWVVKTENDFEAVEVSETETINWSCFALPALRYSGTYEDYRIEVQYQTVYEVDNWIYTNGFFGGSSYFDLTPKPNAEFSQIAVSKNRTITHLGTQEQRDTISHIGLGLTPVMPGEERPEKGEMFQNFGSSSSSSDGSSFANRTLDAGWGPELNLYGGGSKFTADEYPQMPPKYYYAELYVNQTFLTTLDLVLQEGGAQ